jgi:uncharacterized delta-60 repeat protein
MARIRSIALLVVLGLAGTLPGAAGAAPGDLDPSFGNGGVVTTSFGVGAEAYAAAILPNGKIVVAGSTNTFALARYLPDGALDPVFHGDGKVTTDFPDPVGGASGLAIQPNGRIVAVGGQYPGGRGLALARYKRDGGLDLSFDADGKVVTDLGGWDDEGADVVIQPDGKIVAVGTRDLNTDSVGAVGDFAVVRYNPDGSLDQTFGSGGVVLTPLTEFGGIASAVALQDDGNIVVAGWARLSGEIDTALVRYQADGTLDTSFDGDGIAILDLANGGPDAGRDLAIQSDGKLVVAGFRGDADFPPTDFLLARFNPDGSLDTRGLDPYLDAPFGVAGQVTTDFGGFDHAWAVAIESGGKLVAAGRTDINPGGEGSDFALARYNLDGSLDPTFGAGGKVTTDLSGEWDGIFDIAVQSDGAIVAAGIGTIDGVRQFVVARYLAAPCCVVGVGRAHALKR